MTAQELTPEIARAIAKDAGNYSMRRHNRQQWSREDWDVACIVLDKLYRMMDVRYYDE